MATTKKKATEDVLAAEFAKKFGAGALQTGAERSAGLQGTPVVRSGIPTLDYALGVGGLPRGKITEIFGYPGGGKTFMIGLFIAQAQREGGNGAIVDAENALQPGLIRNAGVNWDEMYLTLPNNGVQAFEMAEMLLRSDRYDVIGIDSVAGLMTKEQITGEYDAANRAALAKLMSQSVPKLNTVLQAHPRTIMVFNNQIRTKPGVSYGSPEYQPGGAALPFYSSVRLAVRKAKDNGNIPDVKDVRIGHRLRIKVEKSKVSAPFFEAEFNLYYRDGETAKGPVKAGVDMADAYLTMADQLGMIRVSSSWVYFLDSETGEEFASYQGKAKAAEGIYGTPEFKERIDRIVYPGDFPDDHRD